MVLINAYNTLGNIASITGLLIQCLYFVLGSTQIIVPNQSNTVFKDEVFATFILVMMLIFSAKIIIFLFIYRRNKIVNKFKKKKIKKSNIDKSKELGISIFTAFFIWGVPYLFWVQYYFDGTLATTFIFFFGLVLGIFLCLALAELIYEYCNPYFELDNDLFK